ncbi:MAG: hypothetical protein WD403_03540 [Pirellulales bacterium]
MKRPSSASRKQPRRAPKVKRTPQSIIQETLVQLDQLAAPSAKAQRAISLFKKWLRDESGYDEQAWPTLKKALDRERTRVKARRSFDG